MAQSDSPTPLPVQVTAEIGAFKSNETEGKPITPPMLVRFHAGYFRISLSLCGQALLWKTFNDPAGENNAFHRLLRLAPDSVFLVLWVLAFLSIACLSTLYLLKCIRHFDEVSAEFYNDVRVNYLFAPWTSWLLLVQASPLCAPGQTSYLFCWWIFTVPIFALDVKIYGQWFTKGKRFLSTVANPTSQMSVIGNLVGAQAAARMGWMEMAICMFSLGFVHYLVLFVTLYQRFSGDDRIPALLRPVFFLFVAAPSVASLAWNSISGSFDMACKMFFFLSLFLFASLQISRPTLFKKSMRKFHVAWWAYSFPLTALALASVKYAQEVRGGITQGLMIFFAAVSIIVSLTLMAFTVANSHRLLQNSDLIRSRRSQLPVTKQNS